MAKYTSVDEYFSDKLKALEGARVTMEQSLAHDMATALGKATESEEGVRIRQSRNVVEVEIQEEETPSGVIDLKQSFKKSPNANRTADGGWWMVVPIRRFTGRQKETRESSSGMSNRLYQDLLSVKPKQGYADIMSDYLYDNRRGGAPISELNYKPKSKTITRLPNPSQTGRGHIYVSFRTVSDKSHPASWILNRNKVRPNERSTEIRRIVDEVKQYNFNQNTR